MVGNPALGGCSKPSCCLEVNAERGANMQGLRCASRLERLHFQSKALSAVDLHRLLDLPALRFLTLGGATGEAAAAATRVAKALLPLATVEQFYCISSTVSGGCAGCSNIAGA
jgi:hypothetical protein